ncbi:hypothetical protein [Methylobacterium oxalidis]|uniref:Lipoprotein n=1 Tax=Methylobacterium oxalidis TaxID=944322 RepID=A0A512J1R2_9HYPH|nr:hypothetical protein [Methylobacterium oxalidis]GEP03904.1 hypothetical protein MOX02_19420 [Methylobacterium oxalidis]GJE31220.1 hypothetical protein LDDCCGHA_1396 [Methylobacterium oxalidis]GLS65237.1 hypothetical protein GCM10007888_36190 [Methylobacterium oxalidis]
MNTRDIWAVVAVSFLAACALTLSLPIPSVAEPAASVRNGPAPLPPAADAAVIPAAHVSAETALEGRRRIRVVYPSYVR